MNYGFIKDNKCINVAVFLSDSDVEDIREIFIPNNADLIVLCPDEFGIGDYFIEGNWSKEPPLTPAQKREKAYGEMLYTQDNVPLISYGGMELTVDQANDKYLEYFAEGSSKADEIQLLIVAAKDYIRNLYPDSE